MAVTLSPARDIGNALFPLPALITGPSRSATPLGCRYGYALSVPPTDSKATRVARIATVAETIRPQKANSVER